MNTVLFGRTKKERFGTYGNVPQKSHNLVRASSQYLSISDANFNGYDRSKFAISAFVKRASVGSTQNIMTHQGGAGTTGFIFRFLVGNTIDFTTSINGTAIDGRLVTTAAYTSTSAYIHILAHYDSANVTAGDRMRMFVDGTEITSFSTDTNPSAAIFDTSANMLIGINGGLSTPYDGNINNIAFFSGVLPLPHQVRDPDTGKPKSQLGATALWSYLDPRNDSVVNDAVLTADWTNNNAVTLVSDIP